MGKTSDNAMSAAQGIVADVALVANILGRYRLGRYRWYFSPLC